MSSPQAVLPTLDKLRAQIPPGLDPHKVAADWFGLFADAVHAGNVDAVLSLLVADSFWRDILALTWDFRTLRGHSHIRQFLADRLPSVSVTSLRLKPESVGLFNLYSDLAWIQALFDFETSIGIATGVFRLVPTENGQWKAHCIFTHLEDLKAFPEKVGPLRDREPNHRHWAQQRLEEAQFKDKDPVVLICGGGQSALTVAARLKCLGVPTLIIEKNPRIGDNWRNRYDALCLHDPVWYDHMPYLPFPSTWPVFMPAAKLAGWLEAYAQSLELNVWTSSTVLSASQDSSNQWHVKVKRADGTERVFCVKHLVFATGFGAGAPKLPLYPGMDDFKGQVLHSTQYKNAEDYPGKKVVVIGSCTAAHDIAADCYYRGIDVTMFQRSSTYVISSDVGLPNLLAGLYWEGALPTDLADRINASFPQHLVNGISYRKTRELAELDKDLLDGLKKRGFRVNLGHNDCGLLLTVWERGGGYYLDVGASRLIIDEKIKLKNDSQIARFTPTGIQFENGSEIPADVVVFATGLGDWKGPLHQVLGDTVADACKRIWGLDEEGELNGCYRDLGFPGLWYMTGNLSLCRFHSKHVALQIKAMEEGLFGTRYSR